MVLTLVIATAIVLLVTGNLFDPGSNLYPLVSAGVFTTLGPHLILLSVIALLISALGLWSGDQAG